MREYIMQWIKKIHQFFKTNFKLTKEGYIWNDDDFKHVPNKSKWFTRINPATGLPMAGDVDVGGNPYGANPNDHRKIFDYHTHDYHRTAQYTSHQTVHNPFVNDVHNREPYRPDYNNSTSYTHSYDWYSTNR